MQRAMACGFLAATLLLHSCPAGAASESAAAWLEESGATRGIVALLGLPDEQPAGLVELAQSSELTFYVQSENVEAIRKVRAAAGEVGLLGVRIFADVGPNHAVHLANNVADWVWATPSPAAERSPAADQEILRVLRPGGEASIGDRRLIKPVPEGIDEWTHPYHGPDNNPQSSDKLAGGEFRTQFLGYPKFSPMPEQSVIAGGRIFKAMGHIAHKANQNEMLNTLLCINAYNGTILWKRSLPEGFMIHRNTMVATSDALYMGDHESCKIFDAQTGELVDQIVVDQSISDGPVWKWMAVSDGVLYAMVGHSEVKVDVQKSNRRGLGHWPWGMWEGHDYADPRYAFGYGRTIVAIDLATKKRLWHHRDEQFLDARAVCMTGHRIFCYSPEKFLACIDARDGSVPWRNTDDELLEAIGPNSRAQHYVTGYATTCYMKCNDDYVFFAGPQRERMVVASAADGSLAWTHSTGNLQLVLRDDAIWAAGPQDSANGFRFDYDTGNVLSSFPARRACTRATGCADSIFFRASGGTVRVFTETNVAQHIDPMRPPCQDGVLISNGHLYWGPWMCGCELSLYGNICLSGSAGAPNDLGEPALVKHDQTSETTTLEIRPGDWPAYRGDNARSGVAAIDIPDGVDLQWEAQVCTDVLPTAPITAGGLVFVADRAGAIRAWDGEGKLVWTAYASGPIYYPPAAAHDRLYVGSADGRVYALEARTGRRLWTRRVAPEVARIPVYGRLISRWPVAGGVVVDGETVYAAAGITHYDGTYVAAIDALSGELKMQNNTSGTLDDQVNNGVSVQGVPRIVDGELQFLAGGVYETARYDLETLACLNTPKRQVTSQYRTAFYPYYPEYGKFVSLDYACADGCVLSHDASYEGSQFTNLALQEPLPPGVEKPYQEAARWIRRRGGTPPSVLWRDDRNRRFTSFVISGDRLLATGHSDNDPAKKLLLAIDITDGSDVWVRAMPSEAVKGGVAMDRRGRIYASLENGSLLCYAPTDD